MGLFRTFPGPSQGQAGIIGWVVGQRLSRDGPDMWQGVDILGRGKRPGVDTGVSTGERPVQWASGRGSFGWARGDRSSGITAIAIWDAPHHCLIAGRPLSQANYQYPNKGFLASVVHADAARLLIRLLVKPRWCVPLRELVNWLRQLRTIDGPLPSAERRRMKRRWTLDMAWRPSPRRVHG